MTMKGHKGEGCAEENQDRILYRKIFAADTELHLLAVADGVSRCPRGGDVAGYLVERHLAVDSLFEEGCSSYPLPLRRYLLELNDRFYNEFATDSTMLESAATLSLALLENNVAHCEWVGDSPIFVARKEGSRFVTSQVTKPDLCGRLLVDCFGAHAPFQIKYREVELAPGDVLVVATDGAVRYVEELDSMINAYGPTPDLLNFIRRQARCCDYFDDASLVLAQRIR